MNLADLRKPFPPAAISWRVGSVTKDKAKGMALAYIDARDVQDRLDEVCGVDGWQCRYIPMHDKKTVCEIGIQVADRTGVFDPQWIWKADGAGDSDIEAEKGALSDAFKRAAVRWGIGRYLYDLESPWVELDNNRIKPTEFARLKKLLEGKPAPASEMQSNAVPVNRAAEWALKAEKEITSIHDRAGMADWSRKNAAAIDKLRDTDKALWNALNLKIALRNDELEMIAA